MEITLDEVRKQIEELPIGYYAKRKIPMSLSIDEPTSFYNVTADEITISYPIIAEGLKNAKENEEYKETAIRSMVYHELSHAILTPTQLFDFCYNEHDRHIINVFEDERIETILQDFYMDVNFKKNVLYINGGTIENPKNADEYFYNLVRFRIGDKNLLKEVEKLIERYKELTIATNSLYVLNSYVRDIKLLFEHIEYKFKNQNYDENEIQSTIDSINNSDTSKNGYDENEYESDSNTRESNGGERTTVTKSNGGQDNNGEVTESDTGCDTEEEDNGHSGEGNANLSNIFHTATNRFRDTKTTELLKGIINTFNKKTNSGNGCTGYSGVFNPRNLKNNDYRYFDRKIEGKGNNKFGKLHLNLFIDESGSFRYLQNSANTLVASLIEVERSNPNFTFDLICDSIGFRESPNKKRIIEANGGNAITYEQVVEIMKRHTRKDSFNYNIVLHDGYVDVNFSVSCSKKNPFLGWDRNNVTIIDTGDNESYLKKMKNAKIVITPYDDLVNNLGAEVAKILKTAFR